MQKFDLIIIGGGAAGLMCAGVAVGRGRRVLLLDRSDKVGEKIRISGGGRANFTNLLTTPANFLSENPRFCVSALKRYSQHDFIALVDQHGIAWHERDHGQLFCRGRAQQITDMLLAEANGAVIKTSTKVETIGKQGERFAVQTNRGDFIGTSLVIATGGPSIPKMGASGFAYDIARQFDLNVIEPRPGLVPLTFDGTVIEGLAGVSLPARVSRGKISFDEALLFTHKGLSGPVILQISSYWRPGQAITIDLLPGTDVFQLLKAGDPKKEISSLLAQVLPKRLARKIVAEAGCPGRLAEISDKVLRRLAERIKAWTLVPTGTEGNRSAEVTLGGIDTRQLSSKSMAVNSVPGLYFIGEAVDVTGHLGGFNFQWAWSSGHACGEVA